MEIPYLGETAALITSLSFAVVSTIFTFAGRLVGSGTVNRTRLLFALLILAAVHGAVFGVPLPIGADPARWGWLALSGVVGLALGDAFLFRAFLLIGTRLSMLLMSLAPVLAALLAWIFLNERLSSGQIMGIALTVGGVAWVVSDSGRAAGRAAQTLAVGAVPPGGEGRRSYSLGLLMGLLGATGQAVGLILAKSGLQGDFSPLSGNVIRMAGATVAIWLFTILRFRAHEPFLRIRAAPRALWLILAGAIVGPVIGVSFSLLAVQQTQVGVASTLIATTPVFLLPVGHFLFKERFGWQAVVGTFLAIAGIWRLFAA